MVVFNSMHAGVTGGRFLKWAFYSVFLLQYANDECGEVVDSMGEWTEADFLKSVMDSDKI